MEFSSDIGTVQRRMAQTQEGVGRRKATFEASISLPDSIFLIWAVVAVTY